MSIEYLDVFDERYEKIGTGSHAQVHREGLWHHTFHCWLIEQDSGKIVFQKRSEHKPLFPGKLDVSVAGHCRADESPTAALEREGHEELGIHIPTASLTPVGIRRVSYQSGTMINREFQHIFVGYLPCALEDLRFTDGEVSAAVLLSSHELDRAWKGETIQAEAWNGESRFVLSIDNASFIADADDYLVKIANLARVPGEFATAGTVFHHLNA